MADEQAPVTFIDVPNAPEVFATSATGFFRIGDNVAITFESARVDHSSTPGPINRVVTCRIVLPLSAAQGLVAGLNAFLEKQGASPSNAIVGEQTRQ